MQRCNLLQRHRQEFRIEIRRLLVVTLNGLWRQLAINLLAEEFVEKGRERFRNVICYRGTRFREFQLPVLLDSPRGFRISCIAARSKARSENAISVLPC
jgi:hypothetical protein